MKDRKDFLLQALEQQRNEIANQFAYFAADANVRLAEKDLRIAELTRLLQEKANG